MNEPKTERERVMAQYKWLSVRDFAETIGRKDDYVRARIRRADAAGYRITNAIYAGGGYRIHPEELDKYFRMHKVA